MANDNTSLLPYLQTKEQLERESDRIVPSQSSPARLD